MRVPLTGRILRKKKNSSVIIMGHVLNEEGPGYEILKSIELKNGHPHLKEHPTISKLMKFDCYWFKRKGMVHFSKNS